MRGSRERENSMTIGTKLYLSFGAVLAMVVVLFSINLTAMYRDGDFRRKLMCFELFWLR
jgi:hypothetical protein